MLLYALRDLIPPFLVATIIAMTLAPEIDRLERQGLFGRRFQRGLAIGVIYRLVPRHLRADGQGSDPGQRPDDRSDRPALRQNRLLCRARRFRRNDRGTGWTRTMSRRSYVPRS